VVKNTRGLGVTGHQECVDLTLLPANDTIDAALKFCLKIRAMRFFSLLFALPLPSRAPLFSHVFESSAPMLGSSAPLRQYASVYKSSRAKIRASIELATTKAPVSSRDFRDSRCIRLVTKRGNVGERILGFYLLQWDRSKEAAEISESLLSRFSYFPLRISFCTWVLS